MRKNKCCFLVAGTLAVIILALEAAVGVVFGEPAEPEASSYFFFTVDIPTSGAHLADVRTGGNKQLPLVDLFRQSVYSRLAGHEDLNGQFGFTDLQDINDKGEIVGGFTVGPQGFLLDFEKAKFTDIQCPGAVNPTAAKSINNRGEISGFCFTGGRLHGFVRNKEGRFTLLDFPRAILTEALGINDYGQVVGDYRDSGGTFHGFVWNVYGLFLTIDVPFPEAIATAPSGINNLGQIVGFYLDRNARSHGFLYDEGIFTSFDFPDALDTEPTDINDHGQIVGVYGNSDGSVHGFLLDNGVFTTVDVPFPGVILTDASGINNRGQIVGRYFDSILGSRGFIATPRSSSKLVASLSTTEGREK
jgi:probable HAF family extracellular repeat protein